ncbi:MAG: hypothetical protein M1834_008082 [Cirrosporium novae-zelandiae]|nr:MAG: hypothetical protein M1834_008082 [Cirrosporium novae-zelandiae]
MSKSYLPSFEGSNYSDVPMPSTSPQDMDFDAPSTQDQAMSPEVLDIIDQQWLSQTDPFPPSFPSPGSNSHLHGSYNPFSSSSIPFSPTFTSADLAPSNLPSPPYTLSPPPMHGETAKERRRAQNRAAQKAFRTRKEQRIKHLENKLKDIEDKYRGLRSETEGLRADRERLVGEVRRLKMERDSSLAASEESIASSRQPTAEESRHRTASRKRDGEYEAAMANGC